ncbi:MAG: hypothetical protein ACREUG_19230, partial [Steroidobacteraceae bacterium]
QMLHPAIRRHRPLLAVLALAVLTACSGSAGPSQGDAGGSNEHAEPSSAAPSGIVEIKADMQHALRFKIEPLRTATAPREISGFGRVLDPEPLATAVSERESARASALASTQELHRLQSLEKQNTASMRALQAAEAAAVRDRMLVQSINDRIELTWGRALARRPDLAELVQALVAQDRLIVRVDLPGGEGASIDPRGARLNPLAGPERTQDADYLGAAPTTDPGLQGRGFLFLTGDNRLKLTVGTEVSASLELADEGTRGLFLPDSAVLRYQGKTWVYRQRSPTSFVRVPVSLGTAVPGGWLIVEGLRPNDQVVTQGAQVLLSEELKPETRLAD